MSYIKQNLMAGEQIIYEAEQHWVLLLLPVLSMLVGVSILLSTFVAGIISDVLPFLTPNLLTYGGLSCFVSATAMFISAIIRFYTSEFAVTSKKVIAKRGFISRSTQELLLDKVEGIAVQQGVLGRLLDYGTIIVTGTGTARALFSNIANPLQFQQQLQDQLFAQQKSSQANKKP
jgi:uncharacterized membrane protein YdbT with pleckstrin-like domain